MNNINRQVSRRQFLQGTAGLGVSLAGLALLEGCSPQPIAPTAEPQLETTRLKLGQFPSLCWSPTYVAEDLLKAEGFTDVQYTKTTASLVAPLLASGEIDISMHFTGAILTRLDAGDPFVILAGIHQGCFELFGTERIRTISDLKGKTVAITEFGSSEHVFLSSMMAYVGLNPNKDINWVTIPGDEAKKQLADGKIDALLGFPPTPQELRAKKVGHVVVNSMMDKPWSQYFCCVLVANREFLRKNPIATKRVLRAFLKASDVVAREPERVARLLVDRGFTPNYDYALQTMKEMAEAGAYGVWREYDPEDTVRFYALRLNEIGMIKSSPNDIIARSTDWRFLNELKKELKT